MAAVDTVFAGSIPEIYDRLLVPIYFDVYGAEIARRLSDETPHEVLEICAGTGALTQALAAVLPDTARLVVTDLNQPMLDQAARRMGGDPRVRWQAADALALPFHDNSFDAVACGFGVMFFPDKVKGFAETKRVLRPGGRFVFTVWGSLAENDFSAVVTDALAEVFPDDPPRFMARVPHAYHEEARIRADLMKAGYADVAIETVSHTSRSPSAPEAAAALCQGTPLRNEIEARDPRGLQRASDHAAKALASRFGKGTVEGRLRALVVTAVR
jgi:ubiquinone/menaquinone biosynthesis C-methylase UbiE